MTIKIQVRIHFNFKLPHRNVFCMLRLNVSEKSVGSGSVRSSRNANARLFVCPVKSVLELTIFIFHSQFSLRLVSGQSQVSLSSVSVQSQASHRPVTGQSRPVSVQSQDSHRTISVQSQARTA